LKTNSSPGKAFLSSNHPFLLSPCASDFALSDFQLLLLLSITDERAKSEAFRPFLRSAASPTGRQTRVAIS
jgi:hypothetical protein